MTIKVRRGGYRLYQIEDLTGWLVRVRKDKLIANA